MNNGKVCVQLLFWWKSAASQQMKNQYYSVEWKLLESLRENLKVGRWFTNDLHIFIKCDAQTPLGEREDCYKHFSRSLSDFSFSAWKFFKFRRRTRLNTFKHLASRIEIYVFRALISRRKRCGVRWNEVH